MSRHRAEDPRSPWQDGARETLVAAGLDPQWTRDLVVRALGEDLGPNWIDVTSSATVPLDDGRTVRIRAKEECVLSGGLLWPVLMAEAAARLDLPVPIVDLTSRDGSFVTPGEVVAEIKGPTRVLLVAERAGLNLIMHLSGVATHAAAWVGALADSGVRLLDTRNTTAGLRTIERYAVRCGGGTNGRAGLYDAAHVTVEHVAAAGSVLAALDAVRRRLPGALVQIDVRTAMEGVEAIHAGARFIVLEKLALTELPAAVAQIRAATPERVEIACSGDFSLRHARDIAASGVDHLYVDSLVHGALACDMGVELL